MEMLNFKDFQATRRTVVWTPQNAENEGFEPKTMVVLKYDQGCYIVIQDDHNYFLIVGASRWTSNDLESLERILYDRWYPDL